jgi:hypothetical protein
MGSQRFKTFQSVRLELHSLHSFSLTKSDPAHPSALMQMQPKSAITTGDAFPKWFPGTGSKSTTAQRKPYPALAVNRPVDPCGSAPTEEVDDLVDGGVSNT